MRRQEPVRPKSAKVPLPNPFALSLSKGLTQASSRPKSAPSAYKKPTHATTPSSRHSRESVNPGPAGIQRGGARHARQHLPATEPRLPCLKRRGRSRTARPTTPRQHPPPPQPRHPDIHAIARTGGSRNPAGRGRTRHRLRPPRGNGVVPAGSLPLRVRKDPSLYNCRLPFPEARS